MFLAHTTLFRFVRHFTAVVSVALVLVLNILASSPEAHEHLHPDADHADHECAVVLFAHGIAPALDVPVVPAPVFIELGVPPAKATDLFLTSPRNLWPPERGPPAR